MSHAACSVWFTYPAGMVVQFQEPVRATVDDVNWLVGPVYDQLEQRYPRHNARTLVLDLDLMTSRSIACRTIVLAKAREVAEHVARAFVVLPRSAPASYPHAFRVGAGIVRAMGIEVDVVDSSDRAIIACGLCVAD